MVVPAALDDELRQAVAQADTPQLLQRLVLHPAADPVDAHSEDLALDEADHRLPICLRQLVLGEGGIDVGGDSVLTQTHGALLKEITVHGVVDMHHGAAVAQRIADGHLAALVQCGDGGILLDEPVGVGGDDLSDEGGDILKMVVKGVSVDAAFFHNIPDTDLIQGLFVEQLQKRRFNGLLGKICHTYLRLFCTYSLGKSIIADFSPADNPPKVPKMGHTIPAVMTGVPWQSME